MSVAPRAARPDDESLEPKRPVFWPQRLAVSKHGMVSTAHQRATEAGIEILERGGNAFDAAVAASLALGVCGPAGSGLGGQTMLLIHHAESRRTVALDGSSRAPNRATPDSLTAKMRRRGYKSTTVPSTPAVLDYVLRTYGRLRLSAVAKPAIRLADDGYQVSKLQHKLTVRERRWLRAGPAAALFLRDGKAYPTGAVFRQPVLAETLRRLARRGFKDFYTGQIAREIDADMVANDGLLRLDDLAQIPFPIERRPLSCRFEGMRVMTFPPPAAGRTLVEMLQVLQELPEWARDLDSLRSCVALAKIIQQAALDRRDRPFDPNFYPQVQDQRMLSPDYARQVARKIRRPPRTHGETTHLSVMDRDGNAVALTQSIERVYGSTVATPTLGFLYNDYMSAFEYKDISHPYYLRPNAVPWASVAPTIVFRGRKPWLALGSPGSERIVSAILQVLLRLRHQSPLDAVAAPRLHCSVDGTVSLEASRMRNDLPHALQKAGFRVDVRDPFSFYLGCMQLVMRDGESFVGVADPRRDGSAGGPNS